MRGLQLGPYNTKIDFSVRRYITYALALLIKLGSLGALFTKGLNLGIDFKGGWFDIASEETPEGIAPDTERPEYL